MINGERGGGGWEECEFKRRGGFFRDEGESVRRTCVYVLVRMAIWEMRCEYERRFVWMYIYILITVQVYNYITLYSSRKILINAIFKMNSFWFVDCK